jgi:hypothetical protein
MAPVALKRQTLRDCDAEVVAAAAHINGKGRVGDDKAEVELVVGDMFGTQGVNPMHSTAVPAAPAPVASLSESTSLREGNQRLRAELRQARMSDAPSAVL